MRIDFIFLAALLFGIAVLLAYLIVLICKHYFGRGKKSNKFNHTLDADIMAEVWPTEFRSGLTEQTSGNLSLHQEEIQVLEPHPFEDENEKLDNTLNRRNTHSSAAQEKSRNKLAKLRLKEKLRSHASRKNRSNESMPALEDQNAD